MIQERLKSIVEYSDSIINEEETQLGPTKNASNTTHTRGIENSQMMNIATDSEEIDKPIER